MPGKVKVKIVAGRNLPVMDRSNDTTDAYVEVKCGNMTHKTDVCRKTLNPQWNSEWFRFEMDDLELQDEPLQIRLMDHDTYSANDAIGKVYLDLNPLLTSTPKRKDDNVGKLISGWIPVYDTMHGIRGEVNLIVKIEFFSDVNKFRQSSCGVKFFFTPAIPEGYYAHTIQGFVEELVVNDDPEYQWIDKIRTPRASNEARQTLFSKLSGEVQRRVGLKALELGGSAVIGYRQCFDLEGESGIVVRGIGTAVTLSKLTEEKMSPTGAGDSCGLSRECHAVDDQLLLHYPFARNGLVFRSCKKKSRAPRLHKRSVRAPLSALSMSDTVLVNHHLHHHHSSSLDMHDGSHDEDDNAVSSGADMKERSSSFRNDPLLMRLRLKKRSTACSSSLLASWEVAAPALAVTASSAPAKSDAPPSVAAVAALSAAATLPVAPTATAACPTSAENAAPKFDARKSMQSPHSYLLKPAPIPLPWSSHSTGRIGRTSSHKNTATHPPISQTNSTNSSSCPHDQSDLAVGLTTSADEDDLLFCMSSSGLASSSVPRGFRCSGHGHSHSTSDVTMTPLRLFIPPPQVGPCLDDSGSVSNIDAEGEADLDDSTSDNSQKFGFELGSVGTTSGASFSLHGGKSGGLVDGDESDRGRDTRSAEDDEELDVYSASSANLAKENFLAMRKKRGSRKKDRYSKTSLIKRASENFVEKGLFFGGTERIRDEVVKFFKRKKSSDDNESCDSSSQTRKVLKTKPSPYREAKFLFRKRKTTKGIPTSKSNVSQLVRSTSESHSLGQTSLDSLPSVGSEPVFDPEDDSLSQQDLDMISKKDLEVEWLEDDALHRSQSLGRSKPLRERERHFPSSRSPPSVTIEEALVRMSTKRHPLHSLTGNREFFKGRDCAILNPVGGHTSTSNSTSISNSSTSTTTASIASGSGNNSATVLQAIKELGYSTEKPLKLYISSMDALLVYEPLSSNRDVLESSDAKNALNANTIASCSESRVVVDVLDGRSMNFFDKSIVSDADDSTNTCETIINSNKGRAMKKDSKVDSISSMTSQGSTFTTTNTNTSVSLNYDSSSSGSFAGYRDSFSPNDITNSSSGLALHRRLDFDQDRADSPTSRDSVFFGRGRHVGRVRCSSVSTERELGRRDLSHSPSIPRKSSSDRESASRDSRESLSCRDRVRFSLKESGIERVTTTNRNNRNNRNTNRNRDNGEDDDDDDGSAVLINTEDEDDTNKALIVSCLGHGSDHAAVTAIASNNIKDGDAHVRRDAIVHDFEHSANYRSPIAEENNEKSCSPLSNRSQTASLSTPTSTTHTNTFVSSSSTSLNAVQTNSAAATAATTSTSPTLTNTDTVQTAAPLCLTPTTSLSNTGPTPPVTTTSTVPAPATPALATTPLTSSPNSTLTLTASSTLHTSNVDLAGAVPPDAKNSNSNDTQFPYPPPYDYNRVPSKFSYTSVNPSVYTTTTTFSIGNSRPGNGNGTTLCTTIPNNPVNKKETPNYTLPICGSPVPTSPRHPQAINGSSTISMTALNTGFSTINVSTASGVPPTVIHRRSSESDLCLPTRSSGPTRLQVLTGNHGRNLTFAAGMCPGVYLDHFDVLEYPFITLTIFPPGFIYYIGGFVSAKSVKLLERMPNMDEPQSRDAWWTEARLEIRSHARSLGCNCVIGYEEKTTMCEDVCILSVTGTAAIVSSSNLDPNDVGFATMLKSKFRDSDQDTFSKASEVPSERTHLVQSESSTSQPNVNGFKMRSQKTRHVSDGPFDPQCAILHRPLYALTVPNAPKLGRCAICKSARVPEALLTTIEIPVGLHITGKSCLIQAQVFRPKSYTKGEMCAKEVSDSLPFLEYEIYRRLINKLKVKGMNAVFGLQSQLCLGDKMMVAIASGTAVFVTGLPSPSVPLINTTAETDSQKVTQFQKVLQEAYDRNRELYEVQDVILPTLAWMSPSKTSDCLSEGDESDGDESIPEIYLPDWISNDKNTYVLEVDDAEDIDIISVLIDPSPPIGYHMNCTEHLVGFDDCRVSSQQMFTKVWRCRMSTMSLRNFTTYFDRLLRSICFKLRSIKPCNLTNLRFRIEIPETDEIQIAIIGLAVGLTERLKATTTLENSNTHKSSSSVKNAGSEEGEMNLVIEDELNQGQSHEAPSASNSNNGIPTSLSSVSMVAGYSAGAGAVTMSTQTSNAAMKSSWSPGSTNSYSNLPAVPVSLSTCLSSGSTAHASGSAVLTHGGASDTRSLSNGGSVSYRHFNSGQGQGQGTSFRQHTAPRNPSKLAPAPGRSRFSIEITPLSYIHGAKIERYLGNLNFFFIRETTSIRENGGLSGFMQNFISEVLGIIRAHVSALGGNAMVSYFLSELALLHNPHKNQGQCLINVGGDVVLASYANAMQEDAINSS